MLSEKLFKEAQHSQPWPGFLVELRSATQGKDRLMKPRTKR